MIWDEIKKRDTREKSNKNTDDKYQSSNKPSDHKAFLVQNTHKIVFNNKHIKYIHSQT